MKLKYIGPKTKRFLLFLINKDVPFGGMDDFIISFDTLKAAKIQARVYMKSRKESNIPIKMFQILDTKTKSCWEFTR